MKTVIIYAEGLNFDFIRFLDEKKLIPYISDLFQNGSLCNIENSIPNEHTLSYTSFLSGMNPAESGYFGYIQWNEELRRPENNEHKVINSLWNIKRYYPSIDIESVFSEEGLFVLGGYHNFPANLSPFPTIATSNHDVDGFNTPVVVTSRIEGTEVNDGGLTVGTRIGNLRTSFQLKGPDNTRADIKVEVSPDEDMCRVMCGKSSVYARRGELSEPLHITYKGKTKRIHAYSQLYLQTLTPHFKLFLSPLSFNLGKQYIHNTKPKRLGKRLEKTLQSIILSDPEQVLRAYDNDMIDENGSLQLIMRELSEYERLLIEILEYEDYPGLKNSNTIVINIPALDAPAHTFGPKEDIDNPLVNTYRRFDWLLGWVMSRLDEDDSLFIISDTGHSEFTHNVNINKLLYDERYLILEGVNKIPYRGITDFWKMIDWHKTRAFSTGGGAVYINREHREVKSGRDYESLVDRLIKLLSNYRINDESPFEEIIRKREVYTGEYFINAPDILLTMSDGYVNTYRDSIEIRREVVMKNESNWRYEHISRDCPGFALSSREGVFRGEYRMEDVGRVIGGVVS